MNSSGKDTGVGCHSLLQGIFLTQGLNPGLLHCRQILKGLSHSREAIGKQSLEEHREEVGLHEQTFG